MSGECKRIGEGVSVKTRREGKDLLYFLGKETMWREAPDNIRIQIGAIVEPLLCYEAGVNGVREWEMGKGGGGVSVYESCTCGEVDVDGKAISTSLGNGSMKKTFSNGSSPRSRGDDNHTTRGADVEDEAETREGETKEGKRKKNKKGRDRIYNGPMGRLRHVSRIMGFSPLFSSAASDCFTFPGSRVRFSHATKGLADVWRRAVGDGKAASRNRSMTWLSIGRDTMVHGQVPPLHITRQLPRIGEWKGIPAIGCAFPSLRTNGCKQAGSWGGQVGSSRCRTEYS